MNRRDFLKNLALASAAFGGSQFPAVSPAELRRQRIPLAQNSYLVMGIGGAGNNTVSNLFSLGASPEHLIAVNTDEKGLLHCPDTLKEILIGKRC